MLLAWLVTAVTDEGGIAWSERAGRVLPLAPACAAWGTWLGQSRGWARGEGRVLACLGRTPWTTSAASILGGAAVAWAAALMMALVSRVDVAPFFPAARGPEVFVSLGAGEFENEATHERIHSDGTVTRAPSDSPRAPMVPPVPPGGRRAAAMACALAGLGLPMLVARTTRGSLKAKVAVVTGAAFASILLFHIAAARLLGPTVAVLPSLLLLAWTVMRVRRPRVARS